MKKNIKVVIAFVLGLIVSGIGAYAITIIGRDVSYDNTNSGLTSTNVQGAVDELYTKLNSGIAKKFCQYKNSTYGNSSNHYSVGTMYECDPGDGVKRNFYILEENNDKTVDLIMDRNITEGTATPTLPWGKNGTSSTVDAMKYIKNSNLKSSWNNVLNIDLPKAQAIADAAGNTNWYATDHYLWWCLESKKQDTTSSPYCYNNDGNLETLWLWDYTRECASSNCLHSLGSTEAYGYWTRDLTTVNRNSAWSMYSGGRMMPFTYNLDTMYGVRPVITVLKSNLYSE